MAINRHISHIKSCLLENGEAKLPQPSDLVEGEIAINYAAGHEVITIKNNNATPEIVQFPNKSYVDNADAANAASAAEAQNAVSVTWSELKTLVNNSELVPGRQYRITDYVATVANATNQGDAIAESHQFDIVVMALDESILSEVAKAIKHNGDTYFATSNLAAWELKYCLTNDTNRFAWANSNGKGVIYYMKDEFGNECPYDFKNIRFRRYFINPSGSAVSGSSAYGTITPSEITINGTDYTLGGKSIELFSKCICLQNTAGNNKSALSPISGDNVSIGHLSFVAEDGDYLFTFDYKNNGSHTDASLNNGILYVYGNKIGPYFKEDGKMYLSNNVFSTDSYGTTRQHIYNNTICKNAHDNTFGDECYGNTIGIGSSQNIFGYDGQISGKLITANNHIGNDCIGNIFGGGCTKNVLSDGCSYNIFSYHNDKNILGPDCEYNNFGTNVDDSTLGNHSEENLFLRQAVGNKLGAEVKNNLFGDYSKKNTLDDGCNNNKLGHTTEDGGSSVGLIYNIFGKNCTGITLKDSCKYNKFGNNCFGDNNYVFTIASNSEGNSFGNNCEAITVTNTIKDSTFGDGVKQTNITPYCKNIIVGNGCSVDLATGNANNSLNNPIQNISFVDIKGFQNIFHDTVNDTFHTTYQPSNSVVVSI